MRARRVAVVVASGLLLVALPRAAAAEDISGVILRTLVLSENTRLVGDVNCQVTSAPCISFGASNIVLALNGFTITGRSDAATGCKGTSVASETGIHSNAQSGVGVRGPGVIRQFQGDGVLFAGTAGGWIQNVTVTTNCMSGIRISPTASAISVESNVSVRNGSAANPCGGI